MNREHKYQISIQWTGNRGSGTSNYKAYSRSHIISGKNTPDIRGLADPSFLGDSNSYNPEELLVAAISSCHILWFLH